MIKCALISGRGMGLRHGRNFANHPDAELVAVCDMDPTLLDKAKEEFGVPGYASLDDLLANCDAELMLLITNETRRIDPLRQLIAAGRHVFTEKPLCGMEGQYRVREEDAPIAWPAIKEWRDSGLKFGIDYNYRFFTHFRKLHDDAVDGRLGEIRMVRARAHFNCWSHVIDQILWTMGLPEWVRCIGDPSEDGGWQRMIQMRWASGVAGALDGSMGWGFDDHPLRIMICGTESYAEARGLDGWYRRGKANAWKQEDEELWEGESEGEWGQYEASFPRMADGVIQAMREDKPFPADGEAAWNELLFEAAVHRSAMRDGERVCLADIEADAAKG
ncbi:MAG: Gfo/Idh/MocA family oxidoreductase [Planctomycetes bacterium]|nr:Gfo/Idh/MocA family oxidoreductase [Planctomycetota bacterium]